MYADSSMKLVVQARLIIRDIIVATHLYAVHPKVCVHNSGFINIFRLYLGHRDKRPAVVRPVYNLRQIADKALSKTNGWIPVYFQGQGRQAHKRYIGVFKRVPYSLDWIGFQIDHRFNLIERIPEDKTRTPERTEKI